MLIVIQICFLGELYCSGEVIQQAVIQILLSTYIWTARRTKWKGERTKSNTTWRPALFLWKLTYVGCTRWLGSAVGWQGQHRLRSWSAFSKAENTYDWSLESQALSPTAASPLKRRGVFLGLTWMRGLSALLSHFFWMILLPNIKMKHYLLMFPLCSSSISLALQIIRQHQTALMTVAARAGAALLLNPVVFILWMQVLLYMSLLCA